MDTSIRLPNPWPEAPVYVKEKTGSTMDDALALAQSGAPTGTVVIAGFQESGRGRSSDKRWLSDPWESLLFTLLLDRAGLGHALSRLPLVVGIGVALSVAEEFGISSSIKWPNDILVDGRKLAGILCEAHGESVLVGVGLNCNQRGFPPDMERTACSIKGLLGHDVQVLPLCAVVLRFIKASLASADWKERIGDLLSDKGMPVVVETPAGRIEGTVRGVDDDGALLLSVGGGGTARIVSGTIRRTV